jgi:hypothetical protein
LHRLDCVDIGFLSDGVPDDLPRASQAGAVCVGGIDPNKPRCTPPGPRCSPWPPPPAGSPVAQLADKVHTITGHPDYTVRQAAHDLRKRRGKQLIDKPGRSHRYQLPAHAARTITALLSLRDQVIAPILAGDAAPDGP